ncbi:hypothetical protein CHS0354_025101, partial [Potamilus streckersoni]
MHTVSISEAKYLPDPEESLNLRRIYDAAGQMVEVYNYDLPAQVFHIEVPCIFPFYLRLRSTLLAEVASGEYNNET